VSTGVKSNGFSVHRIGFLFGSLSVCFSYGTTLRLSILGRWRGPNIRPNVAPTFLAAAIRLASSLTGGGFHLIGTLSGTFTANGGIGDVFDPVYDKTVTAGIELVDGTDIFFTTELVTVLTDKLGGGINDPFTERFVSCDDLDA